MCGFVGFCSKKEKKREIIEKMNSLIVHRGPDSDGYYVDDDIALGFRRLSIIDLDGGSQPIENEDKSKVIVFNGEIYNFKEIRKDLENKGHIFKTNCDTEVVLHGYEEYGEGILDTLRGMFAFVIWDKNDKSLFGARDFFGIKPFYYTRLSDGQLAFASEIKSLLAHPDFERRVNKEALRPYLTLQYSATEETFFEGVYKLLPAHSFTYTNGELSTRRYWNICFSPDNETKNWAEKIDEAVRESVEAHKISDVPVAAFLSGGVDSSYITSSMMPQKTFSVGFSYDNFDETSEAKRLSEILGIENLSYTLSADECFDAFPEIQYHMDEPQSNPSSVPLWFLCKLAAENVKVVLSGEGADEIFGGYEWYADTPAMKKYQKIPRPLRAFAASVTKGLPYFKGHDFILKSSGSPEDYFVGQERVFSEREAKKILKGEYKKGKAPLELAENFYKKMPYKDALSKKQHLDIMMWMPGDILLKADKMSMAHSLELRVPYLDRHIMKLAESLPEKERVDGTRTKCALRDASLLTIPAEWANRPKKGFPVPIRHWLREDKYYNIVKDAFASEYASEFFDTDALLSMLDNHKSGKEKNQRKIWTVYTFLVWYKRFFIDFKA
ncbi:MAG: asparagine synthase (glutamine-hydrolyzing) [Clostridia bacterium]|nr:asparagine synthase (glutamine-hydrolyzing) [Clostridia bacterium]